MLIVLTGATGLVGSHFLGQLKAHGKHEVCILSREKSGNGFFQGDMLDAPSLHGLCSGADIVFHMAATFGFDFSSLYSSNVLGTHNVAAEAAAAGVKRFVFFSSGVAYGSSSSRAWRESDALKPDTAYGLSKALAEEVVRYHCRASGMKPLIMRLASVYGPGSKRGAVHNYVNALLARKPLRLDGTGRQARDFVYAGDVANACMRAIDYRGKCDTFNISSGRRTTLLQLISALEKAAGAKAQLDRQGSKSGFVKDLWQSPVLARRELRWQAKTSLENGLAHTLDYFRKHA